MLANNLLSIDLAAKENNITGIAYFEKCGDKFLARTLFAKTLSIYTDEEIKSIAKHFKYVFIDAPLSLPKGRKSIDKKENIHFRICDMKLRALGIKFFPITLSGMRALTKRGLKIKHELNKLGCICYEIYPGASYDMLGLKRKMIKEQIDFYNKIGIKHSISNQHESDALMGLITALLFIKGKAKVLDGEDGAIILPSKKFNAEEIKAVIYNTNE